MKRPSFQFYPGDWLNDAALRACSVGARGLWIDMLCLMHQGSDYGYLKVNHSQILPPNLARMIGATIAEVEGWISELESFGVFSRDPDGCIMSRRMIRDEELRAKRAAGGVLGGNPALKTVAKGGLNIELEGAGKVILPPNLEATPSSSSSSSSSKSKALSAAPVKPDGVSDQVWIDWVDLRKKKKAPITPTVLKGATEGAASLGIRLDDYLAIWCKRGSQGLEPSWVKPEDIKHLKANGGGLWWDSRSGIRTQGDKLCVPYENHMASGNSWLRYVAAVWVAAGDGPWWQSNDNVRPIALALNPTETTKEHAHADAN